MGNNNDFYLLANPWNDGKYYERNSYYPVDARVYNLVKFLVTKKKINMFKGWDEGNPASGMPGFLNFPNTCLGGILNTFPPDLKMFLQLLRTSDVEFDIRHDHIPHRGERVRTRAHNYPGVLWYEQLNGIAGNVW